MSTRIDNYEDTIYELKQENKRLKKELRMYDCIKNWGTKECHCACRCLGNEFCVDADEKMKKLQEEMAQGNKFYYDRILALEELNRDRLKEIEVLKDNLARTQKLYSKQYQINENKGYLKSEEKLEEIRQLLECCKNGDCENCIWTKEECINNKILEILQNGAKNENNNR